MQSKYVPQIKHLKKAYKQFPIDFRPEILQDFKDVCARKGTTPTAEIKNFVELYVAANGEIRIKKKE